MTDITKVIPPWFVYMLQCSDGTYYTGITNNIQRRFIEHNESKNKGAKYTRTRRPLKIVYTTVFLTRSEASKEEYRIKRLTRAQKIELINKNK